MDRRHVLPRERQSSRCDDHHSPNFQLQNQRQLWGLQLRPPHRGTTIAIGVRQRLPKTGGPCATDLYVPAVSEPWPLHSSRLLVGTNSPVRMVLGLNCCLGQAETKCADRLCFFVPLRASASDGGCTMRYTVDGFVAGRGLLGTRVTVKCSPNPEPNHQCDSSIQRYVLARNGLVPSTTNILRTLSLESRMDSSPYPRTLHLRAS